jgi:ribosomal protein S18 acetylase RimI-like enzyme
MIEKAKQSDIVEVSSLAEKTRKHMLEMGLLQWVGDYPNQAHFLNDYKQDGLYVYRNNNKIVASVSILPENDEAYKELVWLKENSMVIHRILVDPEAQKKGIGKAIFSFAIDLAIKHEYDSIKVDTHPDNYRMQGLIKKMGFRDIGYLSGINRLAYEKCL